MAKTLKAGGAASKKPKAKAKGGKPERTFSGKNTLTAEEAEEAFEEIFKLHSKLASISGEIRKEIADEYATVAKRLDIPKKIAKHLFALEQHRRKIVKTEAEFDSRDRDALLKCGQMFGEDTPFGAFALRAASLAKPDEFAGDAGDGGEGLDGGDPIEQVDDGAEGAEPEPADVEG